ncbi:MAG: NAD(P)H-hydrate dehydratase, partial [Pseudomonadota bacterium]|nr:NAD(P)H-hydrate dehydratase [Pseudomonadota bacterium]
EIDGIIQAGKVTVIIIGPGLGRDDWALACMEKALKYKGSMVMDADAFEAFQEAGSAFDADMARKLEADILSRGGSEEPDVLYTRFRGRLPDVTALLKGRGLQDAA